MKKTEKKGGNASVLKNKKVLGGVVIGLVILALVFSVLPKCDKDSSIPTMKKGTVVAKIDGEKIKLGDLEAIKAGVPQLKDIPMEVVYPQLLEAYINNKVILDQAKKANLQDDPMVKKALKNAEDQILFQAYLEKAVIARMTPERLRAIYDVEIKNFVPQDEIHARHILVSTEKEAKDLIIKAKAGANFADLANKYSLDKDSKTQTGGDLGYFTKAMMIPEFGDAAFATPVGKISDKPVKTPFGWHVIKVENKRKTKAPAFEDTQEVLRARFAETEAGDVIAEERTKANVEIFDVFPKAPASTADSVKVIPAAPKAE